MTPSINTLPVGALETLADAAPKLVAGVRQGFSSDQIVSMLEPSALAVLNVVAAMLLPPPFGTALGVIEWVLTHARPMTFEEEQAWMARASDDASEY